MGKEQRGPPRKILTGLESGRRREIGAGLEKCPATSEN